MTCDEAWRPTPEIGLSPRKQAILEQADRIATQRDLWRSRNAAFYDSDLAYMRFLIPEGSRVLDLGCGTGALLAGLKPLRGVGLDFSSAMIQVARCNYPSLEFYVGDVEHLADLAPTLGGPFDFVVLSDTLGYLDDCQAALEQIHDVCDAGTRIVIAYYSHLWEPVLRLGEAIGLRMPQPEVNFLGHLDLQSILQLADFETIKQEWRQLLPIRLFGLETLINRFMAPLPLIRRLCLRYYLVARSMRRARRRDLSASVVIPCRNECGNIENAIRQLPRFCDKIEVIFVEGHSSDGTYAECRRIAEAYRSDWRISVFQQTGKGKGDAVRKGFDEASGDVLMILDADLTVPPKELSKFYEAIASGKGEFINGTRLVYPVEEGAMRILNYWANRIFALIFSFLLNMRFTDTLCGTKVLSKHSYQKISSNRKYFGEFDPFGDYDLIFGAAKNNLKCVEIPIRYRDRSYGEPQISRFRDGWLLLRMVMFAWRKLKAI